MDRAVSGFAQVKQRCPARQPCRLPRRRPWSQAATRETVIAVNDWPRSSRFYRSCKCSFHLGFGLVFPPVRSTSVSYGLWDATEPRLLLRVVVPFLIFWRTLRWRNSAGTIGSATERVNTSGRRRPTGERHYETRRVPRMNVLLGSPGGLWRLEVSRRADGVSNGVVSLRSPLSRTHSR